MTPLLFRAEPEQDWLPYQGSVVHDDVEGIQNPWLSMEIRVHGPLVTRDLLTAATAQIWTTLTGGRRSFPTIDPHPLVELIPKAKSNLSQRKSQALKRFSAGEAVFEDLLVEEWNTPEIQVEASERAARNRDNPVRLKASMRELQKKVYDRVRKWFPDTKPKIEKRGAWRARLTYTATSDTDTPSNS